VPQRAGRVLVVEDEPDVAELLRYNLQKEGWAVLTVANGAEALRRAREARPDVILLDIMVPQLNGWEVCRRLKQDAETRAIPVIMVTGRVEEGDKVLGFELGADDYVTKPFSPRELIARIRAVVRRGKAEGQERKHYLKAGDLEVDRHRFEVRMSGKPVELTPKSSSCWPLWWARPAGSSAVKSCSISSGGGTASWNRAPWTSTSPVSGASSPRRSCPHRPSRPCGASATASGSRRERRAMS